MLQNRSQGLECLSEGSAHLNPFEPEIRLIITSHRCCCYLSTYNKYTNLHLKTEYSLILTLSCATIHHFLKKKNNLHTILFVALIVAVAAVGLIWGAGVGLGRQAAKLRLKKDQITMLSEYLVWQGTKPLEATRCIVHFKNFHFHFFPVQVFFDFSIPSVNRC